MILLCFLAYDVMLKIFEQYDISKNINKKIFPPSIT